MMCTKFTEWHNHGDSLILELPSTPKRSPMPTYRLLLIGFLCLWICLFRVFPTNGIIKHVAVVAGCSHSASCCRGSPVV